MSMLSFCKKCVFPISSGSYWPSAPLRIMLGVLFMIHGYPKLFGGIDGFAQFLASGGVFLPVFFAYVVSLLEFVGGALLILGMFTPIVSTLFIIEFIVATWMKVSVIKAPFVGGYELDLLILAAFVTLSWWTGCGSGGCCKTKE